MCDVEFCKGIYKEISISEGMITWKQWDNGEIGGGGHMTPTSLVSQQLCL